MTTSTSRTIARALAALLLAGGSVIGLFGANVGAQSADDDPAKVDAGQEVFQTNCVGCHSVDGTGSASGRPLVGIAAEQPDRSQHITSVTDGISTMPAFGERLTAEEIDAVVSYVRLTFVEEDAEEQEVAAEEVAEELARTGAASRTLVAAGVTMLLGGLLVGRFERRLRD